VSGDSWQIPRRCIDDEGFESAYGVWDDLEEGIVEWQVAFLVYPQVDGGGL
jgi:hypothetical protein